MKDTDGQTMVSKSVLSPLSRSGFGRFVRIDGSFPHEQSILARQCIRSGEPGTDEIRRYLISVSKNTHKILFCKDLCNIPLLQPTGTECAQVTRSGLHKESGTPRTSMCSWC